MPETSSSCPAFVCGHPISHSRSPKIHSFWLKHYGIAGSYVAVDVSPEEFPAFINLVRKGSWRGGNVTIPHKEAAFAAVDWLDPAAQEIGAVNTLWMEGGLLCGGNTDAHGFAANLDEFAPDWSEASGPAIVLGAGGASRAVLYALKQRGFTDIRIINRTLPRAQKLADEFGAAFSAHPFEAFRELAADAAFLVNTTSVGMNDGAAVVDIGNLPETALVTDIVYTPLETPLLSQARRRGLRTVDGLGMLLHQAAPGFEKWFGHWPEVTAELRNLIVADIQSK